MTTMGAARLFLVPTLIVFSLSEGSARLPEENVGQTESDRWREISGRGYIETLSVLKTMFSSEQIARFNAKYIALKSRSSEAPSLGQVLDRSMLNEADAMDVVGKCALFGVVAAAKAWKAYNLATLPPDPPEVKVPKCDKHTTGRILEKFERSRKAEGATRKNMS